MEKILKRKIIKPSLRREKVIEKRKKRRKEENPRKKTQTKTGPGTKFVLALSNTRSRLVRKY